MPQKRRNMKNNQKKRRKILNSGLGRAIKNRYSNKDTQENHAHGRMKRRDQQILEPLANGLHSMKFNSRLNNAHNTRNLLSITDSNNLQDFMDKLITRQSAHANANENEWQMVEKNDNFDENQQYVTRIIDLNESLESKERRLHSELDRSEIYDYENLPIPRRPKWNKLTTANDLQMMEKESFLNWRRKLAMTAEKSNLAMTPYEKNLQVWRQLWQVVERSDLIVLIVDARNPLAYISRDLFNYVQESDKKCLLLINKSDFLSPLQRTFWLEYFQSQNINVIYFSAMREEIRYKLLSKSRRDRISDTQLSFAKSNVDNDHENGTHVLSVDELIQLFRKELQLKNVSSKIHIGMVGYPNVGKSSIINVLWGSKKVSTSATPGKTKHFQTLHLSDDIILCDCPGLVFPTLMASKADLLLNGVLSIDHNNDFISPMRLMCHRLKFKVFNDVYNLCMNQLMNNQQLQKYITVYDVLDMFCKQRHMYNRLKVPNRNEAARIMLKDFVKGKLLYVHPPPNINGKEKYLFHHGKYSSVVHNNTCNNVLDAKKLFAIEEKVEDGYIDDDDEQEMNGMEITDDEFLLMWKHPMHNYGGAYGSSKKKSDRKGRVMRRMERKTAKNNRKYRRDSDNFTTGSNAIVISSVPNTQIKHIPIIL